MPVFFNETDINKNISYTYLQHVLQKSKVLFRKQTNFEIPVFLKLNALSISVVLNNVWRRLNKFIIIIMNIWN